MLTFRLQTELAKTLNITPSDTHHEAFATNTNATDLHQGVSNTGVTQVCPAQSTVSETQIDLMENRTVTFNVRHNAMGNQEGHGNKNRPVSTARTSLDTGSHLSPLQRHTQGEMSRSAAGQEPTNSLRLAHPENHHLLHRERRPKPSLKSIATL